MFKKAFILLCALVLVAVVAMEFSSWRMPVYTSEGTQVELDLTRGPMTVYVFPSKKAETSAIIFFGSGDGGWSDFEEAVSRALRDDGYEVVGVDSQVYARTDYNLAILQSDFETMVGKVEAPLGKRPLPVIIGGYSMGAAQAIAVAGGPHPPAHLAGLLLLDPRSRGRYGLRSSDQLDLLPTGSNTFAVDEFSNSMGSLRVVQWHAGNDSIDSLAWLDSLTAQHQSFIFPDTGHRYDTNRTDFIRKLVGSVLWLTRPDDKNAVAKKTGLP